MSGLFNPPMVSVSNLDPVQKARAVALLVAAEARPNGSLSELLALAVYVCDGTAPGLLMPPAQFHPPLPPLFADNVGDQEAISRIRERISDLDRTGEDREATYQGDPNLDVTHLRQTDGSCRISVNGQGMLPCTVHDRIPNFGDLDDEAGLRGELREDDGLG